MIKPVKKYLLLEKVEIKNVSESGIILSDKKDEEKNVARVLDIGDEVREVKKGDQVIFETYKTKNISHNNIQYQILSEDDVLAVIKE